ncbi:S8 family serine peptidase [Thauera sp.]|uniref:S8 family serine peptidase n=1 Tax=Thauera sp. TaxID=1905334 RepID=UPI002A36E7EB|nr:S8 family serine peptidase [Thauera sp.]MDX9884115.1 S8 family serine peptidase [Thauera sp.]
MKTPASLRKPVLASLVVALGAALLPAQAFAADEAQWVPGRLLVQPRAGLSEAEFDKIIKKQGGKQVGKIDGINVRVIQLPPQASEKAVAALLKNNKHLKFAERDMLVKPSTTNDPYYANGWHLPKIGTPTAWQTSSGRNVVIAILDSGVDPDHPDLASKLVPGWNTYNNNADTADVYGHGTKVAGAAAALTNNGIGVAAVASDAQVMPMRVTGTDGWASYSAIASALTWAADRGARVANLSFYGVETSSSARSAAQYMKNKGGLVVTSAGNYGVEETIAPSDTMITVSATDSNDNKASWSSFGSFVDVAAPGTSIYSTVNGGGYGAVSGTSFSSPITAGVVALMMSANPALSPADLEKALYSSAIDLGAAGFDKYFGNGRVDAAAAVAATKAVVKVDSTAPSTTITSPSGGTNVQGLVAVDVAATDDAGVSRVDLLVNGVKIGSDTAAPYGFSWDSAQTPDGEASITAYAYDAAGNAASHSVKVSVANAVVEEPVVEEPVVSDPVVEKVQDVVAPVAKLGNPTDGSVISGNVAITGSATDDVGVTNLRLLVDGGQVASVSGSSISYRLNTKKISAGSHTITLEAYDAAGNVGSHSIRVTR